MTCIVEKAEKPSFRTASHAVGYLLSPATRGDFIDELLTQDTGLLGAFARRGGWNFAGPEDVISIS
jgi:hypothetical protein